MSPIYKRPTPVGAPLASPLIAFTVKIARVVFGNRLPDFSVRRSPHCALWRDGPMPDDPSLNSIQTLGFVSLDQRLQRLQRVFEVGQFSGVFHCLGI
jgi:hypothetical protein